MPSVYGCIPSGSRYGNVPNELIHRAGPPFLDNHYRGYQFVGMQGSNVISSTLSLLSFKCNPITTNSYGNAGTKKLIQHMQLSV